MRHAPSPPTENAKQTKVSVISSNLAECCERVHKGKSMSLNKLTIASGAVAAEESPFIV